MIRVLLVEDEINVRQPLCDYLRKEGFQVMEAASLAEGTRLMQSRPDVVLLDWMLPDGQGIELLKKWRQAGEETPCILLTARTDLVDKVLGLELGGNDYVTKPFEPRELVARIRVQLRGKDAHQTASTIEIGGISIDEGAHEARFEGSPLELTRTEFELLRFFAQNPAQVFSREELLKKVWGYDQYPSTRTVDTHVLQLRQKTRAELFETVHGIGYRFRPEPKK